MNTELVWPLLLFAGSSVAVTLSGTYLAKYGDALARLTGWGRLWVGIVLIAIATSLPELVTNIAAATRNQPELVGGTIFGSNMANMFLFAVIVLIFKREEFLNLVLHDHKYLMLFAVMFTGIALVLTKANTNISIAGFGVSSIMLLILYLVGLRLIYAMRPRTVSIKTGNYYPHWLSGIYKTWILFFLAALGVVVSASILTFSVEDIAKTTGLATSFLGVLAVAVVTTMPEIATSIAAARMGAVDLVIGNIYGSCIFNIAIFAFADPFYSQGALIEALTNSHLTAGGSAIILMLLGLSQILSRGKNSYLPTSPVLSLMAIVYVASIYLVYIQG